MDDMKKKPSTKGLVVIGTAIALVILFPPLIFPIVVYIASRDDAAKSAWSPEPHYWRD